VVVHSAVFVGLAVYIVLTDFSHHFQTTSSMARDKLQFLIQILYLSKQIRVHQTWDGIEQCIL